MASVLASSSSSRVARQLRRECRKLLAEVREGVEMGDMREGNRTVCKCNRIQEKGLGHGKSQNSMLFKVN